MSIVRNEHKHNHDTNFHILYIHTETGTRHTASVCAPARAAKAHHNLYSCQSEFIECRTAQSAFVCKEFICHAFEMCRCCNLNAYLLFDICSFGTMIQHKCWGVTIIIFPIDTYGVWMLGQRVSNYWSKQWLTADWLLSSIYLSYVQRTKSMLISLSLKIYNFSNEFEHFEDNKKYGQMILWFPSSEMRKVM